MRLDIRYRMLFEYDVPVWESQNELRVRPRSDERQQVIARRLTTSPSARVLSFVDYWGTTVDHVGVRDPHLSFEVVAEAAVETAAQPAIEQTVPVSVLAEPVFISAHAEYLAPSSHSAPNPDLEARAHRAVVGVDDVAQQIQAMVSTTRSLLAYEPGATEIGVDLAHLVNGGVGVCQDFAHLTIALLRAVGTPARYVSGFLFAKDETTLQGDLGRPGQDDVVHVQTHAWVEAAVPGHGWFAVDPTNDVPVLDRHAIIGHGRDYDDVAPVRGVFFGQATPQVETEVVIERMAPAARSVITDEPRRVNASEMTVRQQRMQQQQQRS